MQPVSQPTSELFKDLKCCFLIPTYNNEKTLAQVIAGALRECPDVIVVNDGSTDSTNEILESFGRKIEVIRHPKNLGKGMALRNGFERALELGFENVITIDSDGQHFPDDAVKLLEYQKHHPDSLIIGARNMRSENVPGKSSFGNRFSNFWYWFETGLSLPDTQSGYRLYPVKRLQKIKFYTRRFEFEIEVIVKAAWRNVPVFAVPVQVHYNKPGERVSHFRPGMDFFRISLLNTWLVILALCWYRPLRFLRGLSPENIKAFLRKHFLDKDEPAVKKALSVGVGIFFGIIPIWGYQLVSAIAAAYLLRLNKAIVILTANISIPPLLPFVLLGSLKTGEFFTGNETSLTLSNISWETVQVNLVTYLVGACLLAALMAIFTGLVTYLVLVLMRKKRAVV